MKRIVVTILLGSFIFLSCSKRIFEAGETSKFHDEYFILRKNGHYSFKTIIMDAIRMPDNQRGRYILSNDTVYFVKKESKNTFVLKGYGIIDSTADTFIYHFNDTMEWKEMSIRRMPVRSYWKEPKKD